MSSVAYKARTLLAKTAGINWLISAAMVAYHVIDRHDPDGTVIAFWLVLATSGTLIVAVRAHSEGSPVDQAVDKLIEALVASRPPDAAREPLRLVDQKENGSTIPAQRRTAP